MVGHQSPRGSFSFSCICKAIRRTPPPSTQARCETNVRKLSSPCQTFRLDVDSRALPNVLWSQGDGLCHTTCRRLITAQTFIKSSSLVATSVIALRRSHHCTDPYTVLGSEVQYWNKATEAERHVTFMMITTRLIIFSIHYFPFLFGLNKNLFKTK